MTRPEYDRFHARAHQAAAAVKAEHNDPVVAELMEDLVARGDPEDMAMIVAFADLITAPPAVPNDAPEEERLRGAKQRAREIGTLLGILAMRHMDATIPPMMPAAEYDHLLQRAREALPVIEAAMGCPHDPDLRNLLADGHPMDLEFIAAMGDLFVEKSREFPAGMTPEEKTQVFRDANQRFEQRMAALSEIYGEPIE